MKVLEMSILKPASTWRVTSKRPLLQEELQLLMLNERKYPDIIICNWINSVWTPYLSLRVCVSWPAFLHIKSMKFILFTKIKNSLFSYCCNKCKKQFEIYHFFVLFRINNLIKFLITNSFYQSIRKTKHL